MKKLIATLTMILLFSGISFAQYNHSSAIDIAFGLNSLTEEGVLGWETTARYEFNMGAGWTGVISSGYMGFEESNGVTYSAVPLVIGTKLYLASSWYGLVETGFHFYNADINTNLLGTSISNSSTEWGFAIGTGYEIPLGNTIGLDLSAKYQYNGSSLSYWNTRAGLMFYL